MINVAVPCEQVKLKAHFCEAVTVAGNVANCITAVSNCAPVFATIVAPAGKGSQLMGEVVTVDVATNFIGTPGQEIGVAVVMVNTGLGATIILADCGELQKAPAPPVPVIT